MNRLKARLQRTVNQSGIRSKAEYRRVRDTGSSGSLVARAARILFLNRTCFKGMWRHNRNGDFNVGYGGQGRRWVINLDTLSSVSRALRKAQILCCDFEDVIDNCQAGDFLFVDPPYRPGEKELLNDHYGYRQFSFADHRRLGASLRRAKKKEIQWALTTSAHSDIVRLFRGNNIAILPRGTGRSPGILTTHPSEVLITSYRIKGDHIS
jgi:DNA adenine methylase